MKEYIYPEYEIKRDLDKCVKCMICMKECSNKVHYYDEKKNLLLSKDELCVNCQRCVELCPAACIKITKNETKLKENINWTDNSIREIYKQAKTGGILLSYMGNSYDNTIFFYRIFIN